mmetsp:Transcript_38178/g.58233  ORF Transcript_38178/g.58233 Transcript_38178/m.58233 type:complete len:622 (-) Transcript_38178:193-2058(-)
MIFVAGLNNHTVVDVAQVHRLVVGGLAVLNFGVVLNDFFHLLLEVVGGLVDLGLPESRVMAVLVDVANLNIGFCGKIRVKLGQVNSLLGAAPVGGGLSRSLGLSSALRFSSGLFFDSLPLGGLLGLAFGNLEVFLNLHFVLELVSLAVNFSVPLLGVVLVVEDRVLLKGDVVGVGLMGDIPRGQLEVGHVILGLFVHNFLDFVRLGFESEILSLLKELCFRFLEVAADVIVRGLGLVLKDIIVLLHEERIETVGDIFSIIFVVIARFQLKKTLLLLGKDRVETVGDVFGIAFVVVLSMSLLLRQVNGVKAFGDVFSVALVVVVNLLLDEAGSLGSLLGGFLLGSSSSLGFGGSLWLSSSLWLVVVIVHMSPLLLSLSQRDRVEAIGDILGIIFMVVASARPLLGQGNGIEAIGKVLSIVFMVVASSRSLLAHPNRVEALWLILLVFSPVAFAASLLLSQPNGIESLGLVLLVFGLVALSSELNVLEGLLILFLSVHSVPLIFILLVMYLDGGIVEVSRPGVGIIQLLLSRTSLNVDGLETLGDVLGIVLVVVSQLNVFSSWVMMVLLVVLLGLLNVVALEVLVVESVVVTVGRQLGVMKALMVVCDSLHVLRSIDDFGIVR